MTADLAARGNLLVAALADDFWFAHKDPGGQMEQVARRIEEWGR